MPVLFSHFQLARQALKFLTSRPNWCSADGANSLSWKVALSAQDDDTSARGRAQRSELFLLQQLPLLSNQFANVV